MTKTQKSPPEPHSLQSNALELSVSDLAAALKRTVEDQFGFVRVRGEISNYRGPHSSGHVYFNLKDASARLDAVIWKGVFLRLKTRPEEGLEVIATGKVTTFPGKSSYQIIIEALEPAGVGALMALLDQRRRKLAAEGLFDEARKRAPPFLPACIGVVTSPTGSVIRDILHRLSDRFPRRVLVWPVRVQGESAAAEVAAAIAGFNALSNDGPISRPDVIIVARGGGSLEDLWAFNEEIVVRAVADSAIPIISAIGHETDTTLIDFAADLRAPTPTGAAEKAVPVRVDLIAQTADLARRLHNGQRRLIDRRVDALRALARALPGEDALLGPLRQKLDAKSNELRFGARHCLAMHQAALQKAGVALARHTPQAALAQARQRLTYKAHELKSAISAFFAQRENMSQRAALRLTRHDPQTLVQHAQTKHRALKEQFSVSVERRFKESRSQFEQTERRLNTAFAAALRLILRKIENQRQTLAEMERRLPRAMQAFLAHCKEKMASCAKLLTSLSYRNVLARGFALVRNAQHEPVRSAATMSGGETLLIEFSDGEISAIAQENGYASSSSLDASTDLTQKKKSSRQKSQAKKNDEKQKSFFE